MKQEHYIGNDMFQQECMINSYSDYLQDNNNRKWNKFVTASLEQKCKIILKDLSCENKQQGATK